MDAEINFDIVTLPGKCPVCSHAAFVLYERTPYDDGYRFKVSGQYPCCRDCQAQFKQLQAVKSGGLMSVTLRAAKL